MLTYVHFTESIIMTRAFDVRVVHRCLEMLHKTAIPSTPPCLLNASYICHGDALALVPAGDKLRIPLTRLRMVIGGANIKPAAIK